MSKNFAVSTVAAPAPGVSGVSLTVRSGHGSRFVAGRAVVFPAGATPSPDNAEVVDLSSPSGDTWTIARAAESSSARAIGVGDVVVQGITAGMWDDLVALVGAKADAAATTSALAGKLSAANGAVGTANLADGAVTAAKVAADVATQAELDAAVAALPSTYVPAVMLPSPSGGDDLAAINALTATASGRVVRGVPGQTYLISGPIVVPSRCTLDMTGCTIRLTAIGNMLNNTAVSTVQRSVSDAAITSGSAVLTSATANFTSADVGRSVVVANGLPGSGPLCAIILTRDSATQVTLDTAAGATVSGGTASIYNRDTDITIIGGTWDRQNFGGVTVQQNSFRLRRADRVRIEGVRYVSTAGKFAINLGDCNDFIVSDCTFSAASDGVHITGPAKRGSIQRCSGTTGDDFVAFTARDYPGYEDVAGSITDMNVSDLRITSSLNAVKLLGGQGVNLRRFRIRDVTGGNGIAVGAESPLTYPSDIDDVLVDGYATDYTVGVYLVGTAVGYVAVRNLRMTSAVGSCYGVKVEPDTTVAHLVIDGVVHTGGSVGGAVLNFAGSTSVLTRAKISNVHMAAGASAPVVRLNGGTLTALHMERVTIVGGSGFISAPTGTMGLAMLVNCDSSGSGWIVDLNTVTDVHLVNVRNPSPANGTLNLRASANVKVFGSGCVPSGNISTAAGYALRVNNPSFALDASRITNPTNGDRIQNTNSSWSGGTGTDKAGFYGYNGTAWTKVFGPA